MQSKMVFHCVVKLNQKITNNMPELPEVEIVRTELDELIVGKIILSSRRSGKKLRREVPDLNNFSKEKILKVYRRNKYLIIELDSNWIVVHLGMTGKLIFSKSFFQTKHQHLVLFFTDGSCLYYDDPRRFGSIDKFSKNEFKNYLDIPLFNKLGIEPLSSDFTFDSFNLLFKGDKNIKSFLMDSSFVCGIGNIYACEILFLAGISPLRTIDEVSNLERKKLFSLIPSVLKKSIELGGSSISDYVHTNGVKGEMQNFYNVYGLVKKPCKTCSSIIEKINQNGRGSYYCPNCQK